MNGLELLKISGHADLNQLQCYYRTTPQQIAMKMG